MNGAPERILDAQWAGVTDIHHAVDIEIEANDRHGLLQDIMGVCAELKTNASSVNARVKKDRCSRPGAKNTKISGIKPMNNDITRAARNSRSGVGLK